jgi:hypothetical protein
MVATGRPTGTSSPAATSPAVARALVLPPKHVYHLRVVVEQLELHSKLATCHGGDGAPDTAER